MPRIRRLTYPGGFYHVFNRGLNRQKIFLLENDYEKFIKKLEDLLGKIPFTIYSYVLLPNHFHFLIEESSTPLAKIMRKLFTSYAVYFNKKYQKRGPVFEDRFKSILVQKDAYFFQLSRYIHLNPVEAGLTKDPLDYPYSSFAEIIGKKKARIINPNKVGRLIGSHSQDYKSYQEFVYAGIGEDLSEFNPWKKQKDTLGSKRFSTNRLSKNS